MRFPITLLILLSFSSRILGYAIDHGPSQEQSLSIRALPERPQEAPLEPHDPIPEPAPVVEPGDGNRPGGGILAGAVPTYQNIRAAIQKLPIQKWTSWITSRAQTIQRLLGFRTGFEGDPTTLIEVDEEGYPLTIQTTDLTLHVKELKEMKGTKGTIWEWSSHNEPVWEVDLNTKTVVQIGFAYTTKYFTPRQVLIPLGMSGHGRVIGLSQREPDKKRSVSLGDLNGSGNPNASTTPSAIFEQYLEIFYAAQSIVQTAVRPVLNNITSQTNSTIIHQMADSIYYDLTGSTTALIGPFNYGMSFLSNASTIAEADKTLNATAVANVIKAIESIYTGMWVSAFNAANSTGIYQEMLFVANVLDTNDTSVYPPGFTTTP